MTALIIFITAYLICGMYSSVIHHNYNEEATPSDYALILAIWPYIVYLGTRNLWETYQCQRRLKYWE